MSQERNSEYVQQVVDSLVKAIKDYKSRNDYRNYLEKFRKDFNERKWFNPETGLFEDRDVNLFDS